MMKVLLILTVVILLGGPGALGFLYSKENRYSPFLKKYADVGRHHGSVSGINVKVSDESLDALVKRVTNEVEKDEGEEADLDWSLFQFEETDDFDEFEDIDITDTTPLESDINTPSPNVEVTIKSRVGKWASSFSRAVIVSSNGTKDFWKSHETVKEGDTWSANVQGSLDKKLLTVTNAQAKTQVNTTVFYQGKKYSVQTNVKSTAKGNTTERWAGKKHRRVLDLSNANINSQITVSGKTIPLRISVKSGAETFLAPFRIAVTLFGSKLDIKSGSNHLNGTLKGEVTSRLVFSKGDKSLTKLTVRGFLVLEGDSICSIKLFKVKSHVWSKVLRKNEQNSSSSSESYEDAEGSVDDVDATAKKSLTIEVSTYSKGRVYERTSVAKKTSIFKGTGAVAYEKSTLTIPTSKVASLQGYTNNFVVQSILENRLISFGEPSSVEYFEM